MEDISIVYVHVRYTIKKETELEKLKVEFEKVLL